MPSTIKDTLPGGIFFDSKQSFHINSVLAVFYSAVAESGLMYEEQKHKAYQGLDRWTSNGAFDQ